MKPSWKDAPSWAQSLACDKDGQWHWISVRDPLLTDGRWWIPVEQNKQAMMLPAGKVPYCIHPGETLELRPEDDGMKFRDVKADVRPAKGGWAPGDYLHACRCGVEFMGDKRARECADCAYSEQAPVKESLTTEQPEQALHEFASLVSDVTAEQPLSRDQIRDVFLEHGFTIKPGNDDLKPYVYEAAEALLAAAGVNQQLTTEQSPAWPMEEQPDGAITPVDPSDMDEAARRHYGHEEQPEDGPVAEVSYTDDRFIRWCGHMKHGQMSLPDGMRLYPASVKAERDALREQLRQLEQRDFHELARANARVDRAINELRALREERRAVGERVKELEADAARYRWLRNEAWAQYNAHKGMPEPLIVVAARDAAGNIKAILAEDGLDASVDAAMQEGKS